MKKNLLWLLGLALIAVTVTGIVDRFAAKRRRELWSEATD